MVLSVDAPQLASGPAEPPPFGFAEAAAVSRFGSAPSPRSAAAERRRREQELRQALMAGELVLCFAGRVSLTSGAVAAVEAIIRWPHRRRGLVPAAEFLPLAESAGLASQVGGWALREACKAAASWPGGAIVGVDVGGARIGHDDLLDQVAAALESSGLPPERLEIELSESELAHCPDEHLLRLAALRDLGVGVALDDFGACSASLSLLKRLPLTTVKLDGSMLRDLAFSREDRAILHAVIQAAHALGLTAVATGIETEDQRVLLAGLMCDAGQGPLFGPPFAAGWNGRRAAIR
jgi:EAL domain-containing protein (putative c-di-GMP-specific phosphodiesterase class I)